MLYGQIGLFCQDGHHHFLRRSRGKSQHGQRTHGLVLDGIVHRSSHRATGRNLVGNAQGHYLVAQINDDALGGHLANALDALDQSLVTTRNGIAQLCHTHRRQHHARRVRSYATDRNQQFEHLTLLLGNEAEKHMSILANRLVNIQFHLFFALNGTEGGQRNVESVTHSCSLDRSHCRGKFCQLTLDVFYHNVPNNVLIQLIKRPSLTFYCIIREKDDNLLRSATF